MLQSCSRVLVVVDNVGVRETLGLALRRSGLEVEIVGSGAEAVVAARVRPFKLAIIDQRLPDVSGLVLVDVLKREGIVIPWLLTSGCMDADLAVAARERYAMRALSLPFYVEDGVTLVAEKARRDGSDWPVREPASQPRSAADRVAVLILRSCALEYDPRTLADLASGLALSRSALAEACRIVGLHPHDVRDFGRILRGLSACRGEVSCVSAELLVSDRRTLLGLLRRAGLWRPPRMAMSVEQFVAVQQFIPRGHPVIQHLLHHLRISS